MPYSQIMFTISHTVALIRYERYKNLVIVRNVQGSKSPWYEKFGFRVVQ